MGREWERKYAASKDVQQAIAADPQIRALTAETAVFACKEFLPRLSAESKTAADHRIRIKNQVFRQIKTGDCTIAPPYFATIGKGANNGV